ncbi:SRPBCC domain-containing protein [Pseudoalteromonas sp. C2R02]|uniref:SRPBCC domain-containing protein n=1 Tax=Pseudoalteromonas sp. C2R02 TaxID=2841565 RepID=UPI001C097677|nr:SRPBCC domain-containing protein [Pseudoalteromonas sp. C2R02]MBU2970456.1 SRPBCC domain-containing protein [Pseudoalteromonas sp. C2R02]
MNKLLILLFFFSSSLFAEVIQKDKHGFKIIIKKTVNVSSSATYKQFLNISQWWNKDHTWFGKSENLTLEPKAGGCFCEKSKGREVLHMTVSYVDPNTELRMIGGLGPLQIMGVQGGMSWKFSAITQTKTEIIHTYQVVGFMPEGLDKLAAVVDKVQSSQVDSLITQLNSKHLK